MENKSKIFLILLITAILPKKVIFSHLDISILKEYNFFMSPSETRLKQTDFRLCSTCGKLHSGVTTCPSCSAPLRLVDYTFFLQKTLGKYTIENVLGAGGMGIVFQALHKTLGKKVALKIFIPGPNASSFEKRFTREARIMAGLKHPNIVEVYDFDISQWGTPYFVMEYLEGKTLGDLIGEHPGGIPASLFPSLLEPVVQALNHAHKKGIVHRDLKPENIFIETAHGEPVVKILDFGIAKSVKGEEGSTDLTAVGTVLGTLYYLAPEQVSKKDIGPYTDQYALALIVAEMFSGKPVRQGKDIGEILYTDVQNPIVLKGIAAEKVPRDIRRFLVRATLPNPGGRFPDIVAFGTAVLNALASSVEGETNPLPGMRETRPVMERKAATTVVKHPTRKKFISIEEEARRAAGKKLMLRLALAIFSIIVILFIIFILKLF